MTTTDKLPEYNGEHVSRAQIKITGAGTGFSGLDVRPIVMDLDDEMYLVVRVRAAESPSHFRDGNELLVRMQRLHIEEMAPVSDEIAGNALKEYAAEIERIKQEMDGQEQLFAEQEAEAREAADGTDSPAEIAADAAARAKTP
jgi:hypothetical protein